MHNSTIIPVFTAYTSIFPAMPQWRRPHKILFCKSRYLKLYRYTPDSVTREAFFLFDSAC